MVQQTGKYKSLIEEYIEATVEETYNNKYDSWNSNYDDFFGGPMNQIETDPNDIFANRLGNYIPQQKGMYDIFASGQ